MVRQAPCRLHLNGSASDPLVCCTIKLPKFRPLKPVGLPRRPEAIGPREGKDAENLGLMDALRGGARAHLLNENGRLLH
jgi:hypothetical protein